MLQLTYPGVYTQEKSSGVRTITGASTSVAHFIGPTRTGIDNRPVRCLNYGDFERQFGGLHPQSSLSYSVLHFFANGGSEAFVTRLPVSGSAAASSVVPGSGGGATALTVTALGTGAVGNGIFLEIDSFDIGADPFGAAADTKRFNLTVVDSVTGTVERFTNLTTASGNARTADAVVNDPATGSRLVKIAMAPRDAAGPAPTGTVYKIGAGPATATIAADLKLALTITRRQTDGTADAANTVTALEVVALPTGSPTPASPRELVARLVGAINQTLRATPAEIAKLAGAEVQGELFEGGAQFRLSLTRPTGPAGTARIHDATITFAGPASGSSLSAAYNMGSVATPHVSSGPSRVRLGLPIAGLVTTATAGVDGATHGQPSDTVFKNAVTALDGPDPFFNLLCLPDLVRPSTTDPAVPQHSNVVAVYAEAARVCAKKFAFLVVDPPPQVNDVGSAEQWKTMQLGFSSTHAAAWFPRIRVDDPLQPGSIISHPPSGAIAGVIARTDAQVGVWQAPAGTEAVLAGVYGPAVSISDPEHGLLNPVGLNVIRQFPIYQTVAFGSRTVDGSNALGSEWKYIPVRRTADYILRSLSEALRWAVHKPNGEDLWSQLRVNCTSFMHGLYRQGAFKGTSARQAYFVACDASTTTQGDIDAGVVNIAIGFAPLKPAEFVVITLRQIVQPAV
ncbi:phage tail sheath family protein [Arthrobacter pascens]|uniref:phage tail sheath family protein n=1 Tax=Arthrobacter pascens TaxID=1677 RepID=UPI00196AA562|nr:phage tail sheath C-terminal domain-containing protein [Arthrobacter pascens]MBN3496361.1 phage tail sheath family protein [Arthrobacter pascens]